MVWLSPTPGLPCVPGRVGALTCPKKRKGSRKVRPLHIQDWKPSAKDEGLLRTCSQGQDGAELQRPGQGGSVAIPCLAEALQGTTGAGSVGGPWQVSYPWGQEGVGGKEEGAPVGLPSARAGLQRLHWGDAGCVCGIFSDASTHKPRSDLGTKTTTTIASNRNTAPAEPSTGLALGGGLLSEAEVTACPAVQDNLREDLGLPTVRSMLCLSPSARSRYKHPLW